MPSCRTLLALLAVGVLVGLGSGACGGSSSTVSPDAGAEAAVPDDAASPADASPADVGVGDAGWGPPPTGTHFFLDLGTVLLMGQQMALGAGGFWPTARGDLAPVRDPEVPLGQCVVDPPHAPASCSGAADCAPEQQCVPDTDSNNQPIAGTEHCETPRSLIDVGPFTVTGFASGPLELQYNAGQHGAYTTASPGDGQIPPEEIVYDTTYTFTGAGDSSQGVGAFTGSLYLPPALVLTAPATVTLPSGLPGVQVSLSQDLVVTWDGAVSGGEITVTLAGGGQGGAAVVCRVADTGTVTIPQAQVQAAGLGNLALVNVLSLERKGTGTASGDGLTFTRVTATQTLTYMVAKQP
jgi:hypothetical protein